MLPILKLAGDNPDISDPGRVLSIFIEIYDFLGVGFILENVVFGVTLIMVVRYTSSFLVDWLRTSLDADYMRYLQVTAFEHALDAEVSHFDQ